MLNSPEFFNKLDTNSLFFIFYYMEVRLPFGNSGYLFIIYCCSFLHTKEFFSVFYDELDLEHLRVTIWTDPEVWYFLCVSDFRYWVEA